MLMLSGRPMHCAALRRARLNVSHARHQQNKNLARLSSHRLRTEHSRASSSQSSSLFLHDCTKPRQRYVLFTPARSGILSHAPALPSHSPAFPFRAGERPKEAGNHGESLLAWQHITGSSVARVFGVPEYRPPIFPCQISRFAPNTFLFDDDKKARKGNRNDIFLRYHLPCIESLQRLQGRSGSAMSLY